MIGLNGSNQCIKNLPPCCKCRCKGGIHDHNIDLNENLLVTKMYVIFLSKIELIILFSQAVQLYMENQIYSTPENFISNQLHYTVQKISREAFIQAYLTMDILSQQFLDLFHG